MLIGTSLGCLSGQSEVERVSAPGETAGRTLADGLLQWVTDDALLHEERLMTYAEARVRFGLPGTNIGMGRVLDEAYDLIRDQVGERIALGVVAYVVNGQSRLPGIGRTSHLDGGAKGASVARSEARATLRERLLD